MNKRKDILKYVIFTAIFVLFLAVVSRIYVFENCRYYTAEKVSVYLNTYNKLPSNYINKDDCEDTSVQQPNGMYLYCKHDYRGTITSCTDKTELYECDVSYPINNNSRGKNRLVYTSDFSEYYYTTDHYETFTRIYPNRLSNILFYADLVIVVGVIGYVAIRIIKKDNKILLEIKIAFSEVCTDSKKIAILALNKIKLLFKK